MSESPNSAGRPLPWTKLSSRHEPSLLLFRPRWDKLVNPRTQQPMDRLVLETPDWVNVVALTEDEQLILVQQYRFGTSNVTTEIPGGMVDRGEAHADAAQRELREETGYAARTWTYLGAVEPNPAFHDNLCHHWLATGGVILTMMLRRWSHRAPVSAPVASGLADSVPAGTTAEEIERLKRALREEEL